jgi:hypothetical protein
LGDDVRTDGKSKFRKARFGAPFCGSGVVASIVE